MTAALAGGRLSKLTIGCWVLDIPKVQKKRRDLGGFPLTTLFMILGQ